MTSTHDAVLVLNPDVRLDRGCARALLDALEEPEVGVAVPRLLDGDGRLIRSLRREPTLLRALGDAVLGTTLAGRWVRLGEFVSSPRDYEAARDVDWAQGSVQLIARSCWDAVGPWDESLFLYSEEVDFDLRARDAGYRVRYVPAAGAMHVQGQSRTSPGLRRLVVLNRLRLFRRRRGLPPTIVLWVLLVAREASRSLLPRPASRAALVGLLSPRRWREAPGPDAVRD